ncbi:MAG: DUF4398 domain-containing protein [Desulfobacterium sp.]|jgi:predicted S18 family serine protease|nr:DUF4398 domain-containing protein [Desulfobacterium sp.]
MRSKRLAVTYKLLAVFIFIAVFLGGCASKGVPPVKNLSDADMAIKVAKDTNATINAPLEIRMAEEKLQKARESFKDEDYVAAQRLADEALIDAKLALERSQTKKTKEMESNLRESIETLQDEINRKQKN